MDKVKSQKAVRRIRQDRADLPSRVADLIREDIIQGDLVPGQKIQTERELCETFDVSRIVVREAIARLRHEGLVDSRQGMGVFVVSPEKSRFLSISKNALTHPEDYRDLYELRIVLECGAVNLAATKRTDDDLMKLERLQQKMKNSNKSDYVESDIQFHQAIVAASKNPFMSMFHSFVSHKLKESIALALEFLDFKTTIAISSDEHTQILIAIRRRDGRKAQSSMLKHLRNSSKRLGL